jgi:hypothetical protein
VSPAVYKPIFEEGRLAIYQRGPQPAP